ncbi:hypothetical protein HYG86_14970 [Alkalicella caledoniensis]|uniref:SGNH hydrolase-type esterase domain-containing protein n=1 Tax=Alkalicella caledoniensis TaxID=2731377 RepID=A0A7G9WBB4_ALKCA|nr:GDSL-type esterase/lipase family protein [Alkalicella caledoniensis]QNO15976.1 hypothetical protein HYG86_14970 [Alkalicella caledoniensis]
MLRKIIYGLMAVTVFSTLVYIVGFGWAFWITYNEPEPISQIIEDEVNEEEPLAGAPSTFRVLALGDSLAKGTGDEMGMGYSGYFNQLLGEIVGVVEYENLGIDGMVSTELVELVKKEIVQTAILEADIILLSIGGNDMRTLPVFQTVSPVDFMETKDSYLKNLEEILQIIREHNPKAPVAKLGLYNPFPDFTDEATVELLHQWNFETLRAVEGRNQMVFVPTFDLFKYNPGLISMDMLHPSAEGYKSIAQRHMEILKELIK